MSGTLAQRTHNGGIHGWLFRGAAHNRTFEKPPAPASAALRAPAGARIVAGVGHAKNWPKVETRIVHWPATAVKPRRLVVGGRQVT
jgi:hypothetical protein